MVGQGDDNDASVQSVATLSASGPDPILAIRNRHVQFDLPSAMATVRRQAGIGAARQAWEIFRLARGPGRLKPEDYYLHGLYRRSLGAEAKREYVSLKASEALNRRILGGSLGPQRALINDKLLMAAVFAQAGVPTPPILAVYCVESAPPGWPVLRDAAAIAGFLREAPLPLFGKPRDGSMALGVMSLFERTPDGQTGLMGDGREVSLEALSAEIVRHYPGGYIFQPRLSNHPDIADFNPRATQAVRIVTIWPGTEPEVLYVLWRIPGKVALSDNNTTAGNLVIAGLDPTTGTAQRARSLKVFDRLDGHETHPDSGLPIARRRLPGLAGAMEMAAAAHRIFPGHRILGWDVVPTPEGLSVLECNSNPIHFGYQLAYRRGFLNPDIRERLAPFLAQTGRT